MKTSKTFQLSKIALLTSIILTATHSDAVYNLYKKDGLTLDINGQIDMQATKQDAKHTITGDKDSRDYFIQNGGLVWANSESVRDATDRKTRLGQSHGVSYVDFRGSQELSNNWRVTGNIGLGYSDARDFYLSNSSLSLDKRHLGAVSLGRQYLHTNYVNRTGTDTPLDIFSTSAMRLDYYGVKGLHTSAYYSFSGISDVRKDDNSGVKSGYGASASYRYPINNDSSLRVALGYTENKANPLYTPIIIANGYDAGWANNALNRYPAKTQGLATSLEYQMGKFLLAADIGRKKETMSDSLKTPLDKRTTNYLGAKIAYDINPVLQLSAGYGTKKAKTALKSGAEALNTDIFTTNSGFSYVDGKNIYLYDKANTKEAYVQLDYRIRPNVRVYGRYDTEETTYKVGGQNVSKLSDDNARMGLVFTF